MYFSKQALHLLETGFASVLYLEQLFFPGSEGYTVLGAGQCWQVSISEQCLYQNHPMPEGFSMSQAAWGSGGGKWHGEGTSKDDTVFQEIETDWKYWIGQFSKPVEETVAHSSRCYQEFQTNPWHWLKSTTQRRACSSCWAATWGCPLGW